MIIDTISRQPIEEPILVEINPPYCRPRPDPIPAIRLWLAVHRLSSLLATMAAAHAQARPARQYSPRHSIPPRIHHPKPSNQAAYHNWLPRAYKEVFRCGHALTGPINAIEAPAVKGLTVFGAGTGRTRFYGAWSRKSGIFVGWMRTRPNLAGEAPDSVYAVGEILGRPIFLPDHGSSPALLDALESFRRALQEVAKDIELD